MVAAPRGPLVCWWGDLGVWDDSVSGGRMGMCRALAASGMSLVAVMVSATCALTKGGICVSYGITGDVPS